MYYNTEDGRVIKVTYIYTIWYRVIQETWPIGLLSSLPSKEVSEVGLWTIFFELHGTYMKSHNIKILNDVNIVLPYHT